MTDNKLNHGKWFKNIEKLQHISKNSLLLLDDCLTTVDQFSVLFMPLNEKTANLQVIAKNSAQTLFEMDEINKYQTVATQYTPIIQEGITDSKKVQEYIACLDVCVQAKSFLSSNFTTASADVAHLNYLTDMGKKRLEKYLEDLLGSLSDPIQYDALNADGLLNFVSNFEKNFVQYINVNLEIPVLAVFEKSVNLFPRQEKNFINNKNSELHLVTDYLKKTDSEYSDIFAKIRSANCQQSLDAIKISLEKQAGSDFITTGPVKEAAAPIQRGSTNAKNASMYEGKSKRSMHRRTPSNISTSNMSINMNMNVNVNIMTDKSNLVESYFYVNKMIAAAIAICAGEKKLSEVMIPEVKINYFVCQIILAAFEKVNEEVTKITNQSKAMLENNRHFLVYSMAIIPLLPVLQFLYMCKPLVMDQLIKSTYIEPKRKFIQVQTTLEKTIVSLLNVFKSISFSANFADGGNDNEGAKQASNIINSNMANPDSILVSAAGSSGSNKITADVDEVTTNTLSVLLDLMSYANLVGYLVLSNNTASSSTANKAVFQLEHPENIAAFGEYIKEAVIKLLDIIRKKANSLNTDPLGKTLFLINNYSHAMKKLALISKYNQAIYNTYVAVCVNDIEKSLLIEYMNFDHAWARIVSPLNELNNSPLGTAVSEYKYYGKSLGKKQKNLVKGAFKTFNNEFDSLISKINNMSIPEKEVQAVLISRVGGIVMDLYGEFLDKFKDLPFSKKAANIVKYPSAELAKEQIAEMFDRGSKLEKSSQVVNLGTRPSRREHTSSITSYQR